MRSGILNGNRRVTAAVTTGHHLSWEYGRRRHSFTTTPAGCSTTIHRSKDDWTHSMMGFIACLLQAKRTTKLKQTVISGQPGHPQMWEHRSTRQVPNDSSRIMVSFGAHLLKHIYTSRLPIFSNSLPA